MQDPAVEVGGTYLVGSSASVQFCADITVRIIKIEPTVDRAEFVWLDVYQLNPHGDAAQRRSIYVRPEGMVRVAPRYPPRHRRQYASGHDT